MIVPKPMVPKPMYCAIPTIHSYFEKLKELNVDDVAIDGILM